MRILASLLGVILAAGIAAADRIHLRNGNILRGEVIAEGAGELTLRVAGGTLTVPRHDIVRIERDRWRASDAEVVPAPRVPTPRADPAGLPLHDRLAAEAEVAERRALRSLEALHREGGDAAGRWVAAARAATGVGAFAAAAADYERALALVPGWDVELERAYLDVAAADVRQTLLDGGRAADARVRLAALRGLAADDPVLAWLDGRAAEAIGDGGAARDAYAVACGRPATEPLDALRAAAEAAAATGVPAGGAAVWADAPLPEEARLDGVGFVVRHRNPAAARRVAAALAWHLPRAWTAAGARVEASEAPVRVTLHARADALAGGPDAWAGGRSGTRFRGGRIIEEGIELLQPAPQLLTAAIPHEAAHLGLNRATGPAAGLPPALAEGWAVRAEAPWKRAWYRHVQVAAGPTGRFASADLLRARTYPPDAADVERFYAGSFALVDALLARGDVARFVALCRAAAADDPVAALQRLYGCAPGDLD